MIAWVCHGLFIHSPIEGHFDHFQVSKIINKADPYAFHSQTNGNDASKVYSLDGYKWNDNLYCDYRSISRFLLHVSKLSLQQVQEAGE